MNAVMLLLREFYSDACAILQGGVVVITGGMTEVGYSALATVSRYVVTGVWMDDLPELITARRGHACAGYTSGEKIVRKCMDNEESVL